MNHQAYIQHILRVGGRCLCVRCEAYRACAAAASEGQPAAIDAVRKAVFETLLKEASL